MFYLPYLSENMIAVLIVKEAWKGQHFSGNSNQEKSNIPWV
jgi:hypothetical protein